MDGGPSHAYARGRDTLRAFARTLTRIDRVQVTAYVLASLVSAFAGSVAAVLLVPLIQPSSALPFGGGLPGSHQGIGMQAALFAVATAIFALSRWLAACLGARLAARYGSGLRRKAHARLIDARLSSLADSTSAEIANVLTYNTEIIVRGLGAALHLLVAGVTTAVTLAFAFWVSPPLMLALPVFALFGWLTLRLFGHEQSRISRRYVADMTHLFWRGEDFPRRLRHIRSFQRQQAEQASYADTCARLSRGYRRQLELAAYGRLVLELLAAGAIAATFVLARRWQGIDTASLIAVCLLLGRLLPYLVSTRQSIQQLRSAIPAFQLWRRYVSLESFEPPLAAGQGNGMGTVHVDRLRLAPPVDDIDVRDLALVPGELTLICGDSGIGKTCLVDALSGMVAPGLFAAHVDGHPIRFDEYRALVRKGAYISQHVRPWHPCVRDCLRWAAPEATASMMWEALADTGLDRRLGGTDGLETMLHSSASRLSGGELQRLLLAQVILRQPVLAVLDEATGALDGDSEKEVLAAMRRRLPRTVLVVVSHRTALAAMADQCLKIDGGRKVAIVRQAGSRPAGAGMDPQVAAAESIRTG